MEQCHCAKCRGLGSISPEETEAFPDYFTRMFPSWDSPLTPSQLRTTRGQGIM